MVLVCSFDRAVVIATAQEITFSGVGCARIPPTAPENLKAQPVTLMRDFTAVAVEKGIAAADCRQRVTHLGAFNKTMADR